MIRYLIGTSAILFGLCAIANCQESDDQDEKALMEKASYILGHNMIKDFRAGRIELDVEQVIQGIREASAKQEPSMSKEEIEKVMTAFNDLADKKQQALFQELADKNMRAGLAFLKENATRDGVKQLESGLQYKIITTGEGENPKLRDVVKFHFIGKTIDGTIFQSTVETKKPAVTAVGGIGIRGVAEAIQRMKPGGKWQLYIPPSLAFGVSGAPPDIEPNQTLVFDVELLEIVQ